MARYGQYGYSAITVYCCPGKAAAVNILGETSDTKSFIEEAGAGIKKIFGAYIREKRSKCICYKTFNQKSMIYDISNVIDCMPSVSSDSIASRNDS